MLLVVVYELLSNFHLLSMLLQPAGGVLRCSTLPVLGRILLHTRRVTLHSITVPVVEQRGSGPYCSTALNGSQLLLLAYGAADSRQ